MTRGRAVISMLSAISVWLGFCAIHSNADDSKTLTPKYTLAVIRPHSANAVDAFNGMTANLQEFLDITDNVILSPDVQNGAYYVAKPINPSNIQSLLVSYGRIVNNGSYLFDTSALLRNPSVSQSLKKLSGHAVTASTRPFAIISLVSKNLADSDVDPSVELSAYFVIPEQIVVPSPAAQFSGFTEPWYSNLSNFFNGPQGANQGTSTLAMQPAMAAWMNHAMALNTNLKSLLAYKTALTKTRR